MLGNAVPSLMGEVLGLAIREQLLGTKRQSKKLELLPPHLGRAPRRAPTRAVPEKYHHLIAEHADHPGEGPGPGRRRAASILALSPS